MLICKKAKIGVIGLGFVGLPLAVAFSQKYPVIGFDINQNRISELRGGVDSNLEISNRELAACATLSFEYQVEKITSCNVYIITVPTPIDEHKQPNLAPLIEASTLVGSVINKGDLIVYESTVFPGATEDICIPILADVSGLMLNQDFFVGYSPERVNPGDRDHTIENILKITSASSAEAAEFLTNLYGSIIPAGIYSASSIRVAEAAKVIENTQRDVNIALINEFAILFNKLNIDTLEVLEAAETKWNFIKFRPGLVGGHCIGVDPYYLTHKAKSIGFYPEMILAGRRLNDGMGAYVVSQLVKKMVTAGIQVGGAKVLIMGLTFKENCPDLRNTKVVDIVTELRDYKVVVDILDPWCSPENAYNEYGYRILKSVENNTYDGIILAVAHREFVEMGAGQIRRLGKMKHILYDLKYVLPKANVDIRL